MNARIEHPGIETNAPEVKKTKRTKKPAMVKTPLQVRVQRIKDEPPHFPDDPVAEVKRLYEDHQTTMRRRVAVNNASTDKKNHVTGEIVPCRLPPDAVESMQANVAELQAIEDAYRWKLERALKQVPIFQNFLQHVWFLPTMLSAALVAMVDIRICEKPSQLQRFCGTAPSQITGSMERPGEGKTAAERKRHYVTEISTQFHLWSVQLCKAIRGKNMGVQTSKYADRWLGYMLASQHDPRKATVGGKSYVARTAEIADRLQSGELKPKQRKAAGPLRAGIFAVDADGKPVPDGELRSAGKFHSRKGWWKAADLFLLDLYGVWRAQEGLRAWSAWYEFQRNREHGGDRCPAWVELTLEQALEKVGHVGVVRPGTILLSAPGGDPEPEEEAA